MRKKVMVLASIIILTSSILSSPASSIHNSSLSSDGNSNININSNSNAAKEIVAISSLKDLDNTKNKILKMQGIRNMRIPERIALPKVKARVPIINPAPINIPRHINIPNPSLNNGTSNIGNQSLRSLEWYIKDVDADKAWSQVKQVRQIKVAVVDTGVDYTHTALKGKIDTADGYNFVSNTTDAMDDNGHGTHVSGIIATNSLTSGIGLVGITGNLDVKIIPVKVLDSSGTGYSDIIAEGIQWAADKGADIINLSLGIKDSVPEIDTAIQYATNKGALVVVAAGNDNADCKDYSPASNSNVYTVSALTKKDLKASYSNYGEKVEISAPGDEILSTGLNGKYDYMSGTSMSTPVVSAVAAIIKAEKPSSTPNDIKKVLDGSAKDLGQTGKDIYYGYGEVNAYNALKIMGQTSLSGN